MMISGSRSIKSREIVYKCLEYTFKKRPFDVLIEGEAGSNKNPERIVKSVDLLSREWSEEEKGMLVDPHPSEWNKYGRGAGFVKNKEMVEICTFGSAIWDGKSSGTKHAIDLLKKADKLYLIFLVNDDPTIKATIKKKYEGFVIDIDDLGV